MRIYAQIVVVCILLSISSEAQLIQIATGTDKKLTYLSAINKSVIVGGLSDYAGKCNDNCDNLSPISVPGPNGYALNYFRLNENYIYCVSYSLNQTLLYSSTNNGANWDLELDTIGSFTRYIAFFDSLTGVISWENSLIKTQTGGNSWTGLNTPIVWPVAVSAIGVYSDSLLCIGADNGGFYLSNNRGVSWPYAWGIGTHVIKDFCFLNRDTIFALSIYGGLAKSVNGGASWTNTSVPIYTTYGITFKNKQEGYVVGANVYGYGMIAKTTDMGQNWTALTTQVYSTFFNIELVNDSIALISGTDGVLLSWNYKTALITGQIEQSNSSLQAKLFPNPTDGKLKIEFKGNLKPESIIITNPLGQELRRIIDPSPEQEIDISGLSSGVYFLKAQNKVAYSIFKLIKE